MTKCLECDFDITSLFGLSTTPYVKCPECYTEQRYNNQGRLVAKPKTSMGLPPGDVIEVYTRKATQAEIAQREDMIINLHRIRCMLCGSIVSMFLSYLVRIETSIFPKREEFIETLSPAGNLVKELVTTYLPPLKEKGRVCHSCFKGIPVALFTSKVVELLPDKENMIRDGLKNVPISTTPPKFEIDFVREVDIEDLPGIWDDPVLVGFDFTGSSKDHIERKMIFARTLLESSKVERRRSLKVYVRPKKQYIRVKPTKGISFDKIAGTPSNPFPHIKFAPNKERRRAFLKGVAR